MLQVRVRKQGSAHRERVLRLTERLTWDMKAGHFTMLLGIFDGYCPTPAGRGIVPIAISWDRDGMIIELASHDDIDLLADALIETNERCRKSHSYVRM